MPGTLEHVNVTVTNAQKTAEMAMRLFGWHIRWEGAAIHGGYTIHVGTDDDYVAIYQMKDQTPAPVSNYAHTGGLNHIGVVVDDFEAVEEKVKAEGLTPHNHADYEPGRRFYFDDHDGVEWEVVTYG